MRCVKEVLRQKWVLKKSHREVARGLDISCGYVSGVMTRAVATGLTTWAQAEALTELVIEERLYGPKVKAGTARPLPDPAHIHAERKRPGVTLELLHLEYLEGNPTGYPPTVRSVHLFVLPLLRL